MNDNISDKGWVCDVCNKETAACLSLCPECNNRIQGALQELKELRVLIDSVDYTLIKEHIEKRIKELEK